MEYALGRALEPLDRPSVDKIVDQMEAIMVAPDLMQLIVQSEPFTELIPRICLPREFDLAQSAADLP